MEKAFRTKPQFDLNEVKRIFLGLNANYVTRDGKRVIKIVSRWRRGVLMRIEIDNNDMGLTYLQQYEAKLNRVLLLSGRSRAFFTGKLEFEVTFSAGECKKVHYSISNFIF